MYTLVLQVKVLYQRHCVDPEAASSSPTAAAGARAATARSAGLTSGTVQGELTPTGCRLDNGCKNTVLLYVQGREPLGLSFVFN